MRTHPIKTISMSDPNWKISLMEHQLNELQSEAKSDKSTLTLKERTNIKEYQRVLSARNKAGALYHYLKSR